MSPQSSPEPGALDPFKQRAAAWLHQTWGKIWAGRIIAFCQFWELVVTGFIANRCPVRATALAYTTLLALIPMIAVAASISTGVLKSQGTGPINRAIDALVEQLTPKIEEAATGTNQIASASPSDTGSTTNKVTFTDDQKRKIEELAKSGIELSAHSSSRLRLDMVREADVIYCMTRSHLDMVLATDPSAVHKTELLDPNGDVDDPIGAGLTIYQRCAEVIRRRLDQRLKEQQP